MSEPRVNFRDPALTWIFVERVEPSATVATTTIRNP